MIAAHFTADETLAWFFDERNNSYKVNQEMFAKFGIHSLLTRSGQAEEEYMANKMLVEAKDFKGLTFRGVGWTGFVISSPEFGASCIVMPSTENYSALQSGVIDACESGGPYGNFTTNSLSEVCRYAGFPGMHQFSQTTSFLINAKKWKVLPPDVQMILTELLMARNFRTYAFTMKENAEVMDKVAAYGTVLVRESPACQRAWRDVSWRIADVMAKDSKDFAELWGRMKAYMGQDSLRGYLEAQTPAFGKKINFYGAFSWLKFKKELGLPGIKY